MTQQFEGPTPTELKNATSEHECRTDTIEFLRIKKGIAEQLLAWRARLAERTPATSGYLIELEGDMHDLVPWGREPSKHRGMQRLLKYQETPSVAKPSSCEIVVVNRGEKSHTFLWLEKKYHAYDSVEGVLVTSDGLGHNAILDRKTGTVKDDPPKAVLLVESVSIRDFKNVRFTFPTETEPEVPEHISFEEGDELKILKMPVPLSSRWGYFYNSSDKLASGFKPDPLLLNEQILNIKDEDLAAARSILEALTPKR